MHLWYIIAVDLDLVSNVILSVLITLRTSSNIQIYIYIYIYMHRYVCTYYVNEASVVDKSDNYMHIQEIQLQCRDK